MNQGDLVELLEKAKLRDEEALESLLQIIQPIIYRFGMTLCRHQQDAEDILQDTLLSFFNSFHQFRNDAALSTWLYQIARNFCIKKRRKDLKPPSDTISLENWDQALDISQQDPLPDANMESKETWAAIKAALKNLDPSHREVLYLRDIEGLKTKEVAEILDLKIPAVKSRLHRARAALRGKLKPETNTPNCPNIRKIFSQFLEGELRPNVCLEMQQHVQTCSHCKKECDGLKQLLNLCQTAPSETVPAKVKAKIRTAARKALFGEDAAPF